MKMPKASRWLLDIDKATDHMIPFDPDTDAPPDSNDVVVVEQVLVTALEERVAELELEHEQDMQSFNLRWSADMRGVAKWRAAGPGRDMTLPDHADMVAWLLDELHQRDQALDKAAVALTEEPAYPGEALKELLKSVGKWPFQ